MNWQILEQIIVIKIFPFIRFLVNIFLEFKITNNYRGI